MTGRELIIYILSNNLEDKEVIEDGKLLGHISDIDLAKEFNCGVATILTHMQLGDVKGFKLGNTYYIPQTDFLTNINKVSNI